MKAGLSILSVFILGGKKTMSPLDSIKWIKRFEKLSYTAKEKWPSHINKRTYINSQSDTISYPSTDQKKKMGLLEEITNFTLSSKTRNEDYKE